MTEAATLDAEIRRRVAVAGPMPVAEYMALCLAHPVHGYYRSADPLGARGDFITAPEVSQMFGELVGLWLASVWQQMGAPENVRLVELGPGRGTLMKDALRASKIVPGFNAAIVLHLVEINPVLKAKQEVSLAALSLPMFWHEALSEVPAGPALIVANEFFDALPVHQAVKAEDGWHERCVGVDAAGNLAFTLAADPLPGFERLLPERLRRAPAHSVFEWRDDKPAMELGRRVAGNGGGAALVIDYGHSARSVGDTLQAVAQHEYADPLAAPGGADLTAHVDFAALARAAEAMGARAYGPIEQGMFLSRLGIEARADTLKANTSRVGAVEIDAALERLTGSGRSGMGALFKALALTSPRQPAPAAFEG